MHEYDFLALKVDWNHHCHNGHHTKGYFICQLWTIFRTSHSTARHSIQAFSVLLLICKSSCYHL